MKIAGVNTITGLNFESKVDFQTILGKINGYKIDKIPNKTGIGVFFRDKLAARYFIIKDPCITNYFISWFVLLQGMQKF